MREPLPPRGVAQPSADSVGSPVGDASARHSVLRPEVRDERLTALAIRRVLDRGTDHLPYRISERLAQGRARALARMADPAPAGAAPARAGATSLPAAAGRSSSWRWRLAAVGVSLMAFLGFSALVDSMQEEQSVEEMAEVNNALLTDELPLDAYADRGFGVFLVNTRKPQTQAVSYELRR